MTKKQCVSNLSIDPTDYADPLFGVGSATSAGPSLPTGSIHPSPETLEKDNGGYTRNQPIIGFGQLYTSGSGGVKCYGNYLLAPMVGDVELDSKKRASMAIEGSERGRCYEYTVTLSNGISARVTPAHNSAIYAFTYPENEERSFIIDAARKLDIEEAMKNGSVTVDPKNKTVYGGGLYKGNLNNIDWDMFFCLEFDSDFIEIGVFKGEELIPCTEITTVSIDKEQRLGAYVKFGKSNVKKEVRVKISISFVSTERAREFLDAQIPEFDYGKVMESARNKWRKVMNVIDLKTDSEDILRRFYTAMYHMNLQPRDRTDDHGKWDDFHTIWDSWKTNFPMYSLLYPEKMGAIIDSFVDRAKENEKNGNGIAVADAFMAAKEYPAGQGGNDTENVMADAIIKDIPLKKYTQRDVYETILRSAEMMRSPEYVEKGYAGDEPVTVSGARYSWRFKAAAATQGFAFNDKAVAAVAKKLGTDEEYQKYEKRSESWKNIWNMNVTSEGFCGFPQKLNDNREFDEDFDPHGGYNKFFYEMTGWDASYVNYNDVPRLVEIMGGADTFCKRLQWACEHSVNYFNDDHGAEGYLNFTNEPSFHIPWLFCNDEIRRPDLAAKVIDTIIERFSKLNDYPGDEDNGGMSSYYVFLMCGFFPYATTENYYLHGTRVKEILFRLGNGKEFRVTGENVGIGNIYVQSATWQGKSLNECKLTHKQILEGGELHFVMGDKPSDWAN